MEFIHRWCLQFYTPPPAPPSRTIRSILEIAYLASLETDELRPSRFVLCCVPRGNSVSRSGGSDPVESWGFVEPRVLTPQELRRLCAASHIDRAAVLINYDPDRIAPIEIAGLLNLGSAWVEARDGFSYYYDPLPFGLNVRVDAPGSLTVYQGMYSMFSLRHGQIETSISDATFHFGGIHGLISEGSSLLSKQISWPRHEPPAEWGPFAWTAYSNVLLAIINTVRSAHHGGTVIIVPDEAPAMGDDKPSMRCKYRLLPSPTHLQARFVDFMNIRNKWGDLSWRLERKNKMTTADRTRLAALQIKLTTQSKGGSFDIKQRVWRYQREGLSIRFFIRSISIRGFFDIKNSCY